MTLFKNGNNLYAHLNSKTNEPDRFNLDLTDKLKLKNPNKNIKSEYNNNKFKISWPTWNHTFDSLDVCYSIFDIQDYFEFLIKKHETLNENPPIQICPNKIKNRIVFETNTGYKLELLTPETIELLGSTKNRC